MAGEALHEDRELLGPEILDRHRAISTIMEELEAIDWYNQRIKASSNAELQAVLAHNRNEEKEHASMLLEWLRRHDSELDTHLRTYLFSQGPIREVAAAPQGSATSDGSLGYGHSIQRIVGTSTKDQPIDITVRVTDVYRKINGKWLIVHEHVSVPVDLDTGKPDLSSRP